MLRKIIYFKLVILALILIGITVFILTFDLNRYKPDVETKLSQAIGYPVKIESLSLSLHKGLALQVKGLSIHAVDDQFAVFLDRFFLIAELKPLFKRHIKITQCLIESPQVEIRGSKGLPVPPTQVSIISQSPKMEPSQNLPSKPKKIKIPYVDEFNVSKIVISNGEVLFGDGQNGYSIRDIDLILNNVAFESPTGFQGSCKLDLGLEKQISVKGTLNYPEQLVDFVGIIDQNIEVKGSMANFMRVPVYRLEVALKNLDIASFYTPAQREQEYLAGSVYGNVALTTSGKSAIDIVRSLQGEGHLQVINGALKNRNILRENLEKITQIPGLNILFQVDLGPAYQTLLNSPDTSFQELNTALKIERMRVHIQSLSIQHPEYSIGLSGTFGFNLEADLQGSLALHKTMAAALIKKVKELVWIANPAGEIVIPFSYQGVYPHANLKPDVGHLVKQTVETVGMDLLNQALNQFLAPEESQKTSAPTS
ncbi:MAG: hypothetical protein COV74_08950 [Candidatus Omnitrophica bacterium CG11_big_fil_rev_8_21_14_0_20_45_26]|uniref:AsmA domain-containing protein n=1 Tax=Candidatus Abzuiibacterium crystallinum TaxID=1974748 RepID=A0A2H0LLZ2_9BACT|nr:MAG: hypothetical protein COV74_08950 [Candidatus Omnitrophica bacterium CG11_big_fil_rev_8_21_14_0_20_45_26]